MLAVNREYAGSDTPLRTDDELALIPPVSGGGAEPAVHVAIRSEPLGADAITARVADPRAGALVTFLGVTREVQALEYEAYAEMAQAKVEQIATAAAQRHGLCAVAVEHRIGTVPLSEPSVVIAVSAPHRAEAFAGAREIIDSLKRQAPIWKREEGEWVERAAGPYRFLAMPTSLVTGGAGFLGSHLCDALLANGHRVICVDNLETGSLNNIAHLRGDEFVHLNVDIIEPYFVDQPLDFVYHFASPASPIDYLRIPLHTLKVGSYGTHHTLGLAKRHRARFLTASTSEVYGDPQVHPQPESYWGHVNPIGPRGVYDEAKRFSEALDDGLPPPAGGRYGDRADLQHLRSADARP